MPLTYTRLPLVTWTKPRWGTKRMYRIYETQFSVSSYDTKTGRPKSPFNKLSKVESNRILSLFHQITFSMSFNIQIRGIYLRNDVLSIRFSIPKYDDVLDVVEELCVASDDFYTELRDTTIVIDSYITTLMLSGGTNWISMY